MSREAQLLIDAWEAVRDHLPAAKRADAAIDLVQAFESFGYDADDLSIAIEEDPDLANAFEEVFAEDAEDGGNNWGDED